MFVWVGGWGRVPVRVVAQLEGVPLDVVVLQQLLAHATGREGERERERKECEGAVCVASAARCVLPARVARACVVRARTIFLLYFANA
jgi:hypothetical protein